MIVSELLLPTAVYVVVLLAIGCISAFRRQDMRWPRLRYVLVALLLWSYCFSTPKLAVALMAPLEASYPPVTAPARAGDALIVVLSSGSVVKRAGAGWDARLDEAGWERSYAAIRLWKQVGGHILYTGEPTPDGATSVAATMAAVATTSGVPAAAIHVETQSRNTYENLAFSKERLAAQRGPLWLVTSAMHMRRAMAVARKLGLAMQPYPCDYRAVPLVHWYAWLPNSGGPAMFADSLHEWIGLVYYRIKGYSAPD